MTTVFTSALGVPIDSEGLEEGCNLMPAALRRSGLMTALAVRDLGDVEAGPVRGARDPVSGVRGPDEVAAVSLRLRDALLPLLRAGERPLVVGGCCAVLLGAGLAVREVAGRAGLAFVDGHEDFYDGHSSLSGCVADMELSVVTGNGPAGLLPAEPRGPLFRDADVIALGVRDSAIARDNGSPDPRRVAPSLRIIESASVLAAGPAATAQRAAAELAAGPGRFWLHLDLDVIDGEAMPAVDDPLPGGPDWEQTADLLRPLLHSPGLLGADVTILNPSLDPDDHYAHRVVDLLAAAGGVDERGEQGTCGDQNQAPENQTSPGAAHETERRQASPSPRRRFAPAASATPPRRCRCACGRRYLAPARSGLPGPHR